jgi:hypothetical protein
MRKTSIRRRAAEHGVAADSPPSHSLGPLQPFS